MSDYFGKSAPAREFFQLIDNSILKDADESSSNQKKSPWKRGRALKNEWSGNGSGCGREAEARSIGTNGASFKTFAGTCTR